MSKIIITQSEPPKLIRSDGRESYIPPDQWVREEAELSVRLRSTKGQKAKWWLAESKAAVCLNNAPFEPMFRGVVSMFRWVSRPFQEPPSVSEQDVVQGGRDVLNWQARAISPLLDSVGKIVASVASQLHGKEPELKQGHLNVWSVPTTTIPYRSLPHSMRGRWVYNHYVHSSRGFFHAVRVIDNVAWGVFVISLIEGSVGDIFVLSQDHPEEEIVLRSCHGIVVSHPVPLRSRNSRVD